MIAARGLRSGRYRRRAHDRQRLKDACEQLLSSEGWQRWARARARNDLARYSVSNLCLILQANPDASFVAGFKAWLDLGYCVRKGEHAIWIFAPIPTRRRGSDPTDDTDEQEPRVRFRAVPVFDTLSRDLWSARSRGLSRREPGLLASSLEWSRGGAGEEPGGPDTLLAFLEGL